MALPFGDGPVIKNPSFVTGFETPDQRLRRLRETNDALKKNQEREEARNAQRLLDQFDRQDIQDMRLSPASPPRTPETPPDPDEQIRLAIGSQDRYESFLDDRLGSYESTYGTPLLFGSLAYGGAERLALDDWRKEQGHVPDDIVQERAGINVGGFGEIDLINRSRVLREGVTRPPPDVASGYDLVVDNLVADVAAGFVKGGIPLEGGAKRGVSEEQALEFARDGITRGLDELAADIKADNPNIDDQTVREVLYRGLRTQDHLSDVLDEMGWPRDAEGFIDPPLSAYEEAERREEEENGKFFEGLPVDPGFFGQIERLYNKKWIPTFGGQFELDIEGRPVVEDGKPVIGESTLQFKSFDELHVAGQKFADPVASILLDGIAAPVRVGEQAFGEVTGVETTAVSGALQSQLAEDILSEIISPEYLLIALPFAGAGVAARGTRLTKTLQLTSNLFGAGGLAVSAPVGLFKLGRVVLTSGGRNIRGVFRGLTAVARNPQALKNLPRAIRNDPLFQRGLRGLQEARAGMFGRGGTGKQYIRAIGGDDPVRLRQVQNDLLQGAPSSVDNLPLRQAVMGDLSSGRSWAEIVETGVTPQSGLRGWKIEESGRITRQVGKIRMEGHVFAEHITVDTIGKGTIANLRRVEEDIARLVVGTGKPMRTAVVNDRLIPVLERSRSYTEIERFVPEGLAEARGIIEARTGRPLTTEFGKRQFEMSVSSAQEILGEVPSFWLGTAGERGGGFLPFGLGKRVEVTENNIFTALSKGEPVSHASLQRVVRELEVLPVDLVERATSLEMIELLQARRVSQSLGTQAATKLKKAELFEMVKDAGLPLNEKATRNQLLKELSAASKRGEDTSKAIEGRLWEALSDTDVVDLFQLISEGKLQPGIRPTQLVPDASLNKLKDAAFNPSASLSARTKSIESYVAGVEKLAAKSTGAQKVILEAQAKQARWSFDTQFGLKPLVEAQTDIRESLRILISEHRGTVEERLAKLATGRSKEIIDEVNLFLDRFPKLSKTQRDRMSKRLLTLTLDAESGVEIYDAGVQLETMLKIVGVDQKLKDQAYRALQILTTRGATPSPSEISAMRKILDPVLGKGATSQLLNARTLTVKGQELVINSIGLPRALMASSDLSALARQGGIIGPRMPIQWAKMGRRSIQAFFQPEYADDVRRSIVNSGVIRLEGGEVVDIYQYATKNSGLFLASDAGQLGLTFKEEEWMTHFASKWGWHLPRDAKGNLSLKFWDLEKVPFFVPLAQSERSYVMGLDKLRMDFFSNEMKKFIRRGMANGRSPTLADFKDLALFTNNATGRGKMWEFLRSSTPILNALLFAPRLVISRVALIGDVVRFTVKGGPMRRAVWETLAADGVTLAGGMFLIVTALNAAGLDASVDFQNPLKKGEDGKLRPNTDFMKLVVGDSHIDFLASMGPTQRLMVGLAVAAYQGNGELAAQLAETFARSKEAPVPSALHDVISGQDFIGGKIDLSLNDLLLDVVASRSIPLSWQGPIEAIAAMRGEFDIDTGEAVIDLATNKPNKLEAIQAGIALSAEMVGGGVVSFFNPGEKLREADEEKLQELVGGGQIQPTEGQTIENMNDLNKIQAEQVEDARGPEEKELQSQQEEQGLWRDSEWAVNKKAERDFHETIRIEGGYYHPETGKFVPLLTKTQEELDDLLLSAQIDGGAWASETARNKAAIANAREALFGIEGEDIEDIENPVDKLIAEYWQIKPIDFLKIGTTEYDWDGYNEAKDAKQAEISAAIGDPVVVAEYFDAIGTRGRRTEVEKRSEIARDQRDILLDDTPMYMAGVTDRDVNNLLDSTEEYLRSTGSRWSLARYIQWLYYQNPAYQTNEWAVAYWVAAGERDEVTNPERTQMVMENPDMVLFYPGLFRGMTDDGRQNFLDQYGTTFLSKSLVETFIESGQLSTQSETELFKPQALF